MAAVVMAEAKSKKGPKMLSHLEIHPKLGGGHIVKHVYEGYQHEPRQYSFGEDEGHRAAAHLARHAGLPSNSRAEEEPSETEGEIEERAVTERKFSRRGERKPVKGEGSAHENARDSHYQGA